MSSKMGSPSAGFCADSLMGDGSIYNGSSIPNVSSCFQHTFLVIGPSVFFWLLFPLLLFQAYRSRNANRFLPLPLSGLFAVKIAVAAVLVVDTVFLFSRYFTDKSDGRLTPAVDAIYPLFLAVTASLLLVGHLVCKQAGFVSSGAIFNAWLLLTVCGCPELYHWIQVATAPGPGQYSSGRMIGFLIWWTGCLFETFLFCFADPRSNKEVPHQELDSSFLNRLTIYWFTRLPLIGAKKDLEVHDLFDLNQGNKAHFMEERWNHYWVPTMKDYNERKKLLFGDNLNEYGSNVPDSSKKALQQPSIIYNLFKMFKFEFMTAMGIKICSDVLQFANPFLLKLLLDYVSDVHSFLWQGIAYSLLMLAASQLRSFLLNYYFFIVFRLGIKLQSAMTAAVYRKTLKLSNVARREKTVGEIVNLMAIDVERFQMISSQIQQFWSSPFQIVLALVFLFNTLGVAALPGVAITGLFIPYTIFTSRFLRRWMGQQMKLKDERTKICNEVLNGIKVVKLYAWEYPMMALIEKIRRRELFFIFKSSLLKMTVDVFNYSTPFFVALLSFTTYTLTASGEHKLTPQIAFVSLTLFNQLRSPMTMLGFLINVAIEASVSNKRLKNFFVAEELDEFCIDKAPAKGGVDDTQDSVESKKANFSWDVSHNEPESDKTVPNLREITLKIPKKALVAVVGRVGSGKSSLLSALLGEMEKLKGSVRIRGKIAYVPQQAWIQNMTLRDNILFGQPFVKKYYDKVVEACALTADLAVLPHGDRTEIGEKGINLSGGQKARISLARSIYQNCDIYFLDDPLSAVDSHVGKHIFNKVLGPHGMLRNKTRILVTHAITFLNQVDQVVVVDNGSIIEQGKLSDLSVTTFSKLSELVVADPIEEETAPVQRQASAVDENNDENEEDDVTDPLVPETDNELADVVLERQMSTVSFMFNGPEYESRRTNSVASVRLTSSTKLNGQILEEPEKTGKELMTKETVETGRVNVSVYSQYVRAGGLIFMGIYFVSYIVYQSVTMGRNLWLSKWADDNDPVNQNKSTMTNASRLTVYASLGGFEIIVLIIALMGHCLGTLRASKNLHKPVLYNILRSPMSFFDTTPVGRILNRLSKDIETVDMRLPMNFRFFVTCLCQVGFTLIIICVTTPIFTIVIIPLTLIYILSLKYYVPTSRQLKRLESNNRSPIYSHFSESIQGAAVIRAYDRSDDFCEVMGSFVDKFIHVKYMNLLANRWLAIRLEFVGNLVVFFAAMFAVLSTNWGWISSAGLVGLSISYALNITEVLNFAVRQVSELETNIVAVERLKEYTETETEAAWKVDGKEPPKGWPVNGQIKFNNYSTRYRSGLDLVVKNMTVDIKSGEKIGIVGRTGAGKSSMTLALFRMIEAAEGQIVIDGVVIAEIGLHDLRSNITIIPQDPVLFSGSLRFNLDPFEKYSDDQIWTALEMAHLKQFISQLPDGLDHKISEGGDNISVGQRQLVCLTRALLRRSKILVLDEATAAVDLETDALIQETIRTEFKHSTIITIAHRLNTILDYDKVMVLDKGEIQEFDSPDNLLGKKESLFAALVEDSKASPEK